MDFSLSMVPPEIYVNITTSFGKPTAVHLNSMLRLGQCNKKAKAALTPLMGPLIRQRLLARQIKREVFTQALDAFGTGHYSLTKQPKYDQDKDTLDCQRRCLFNSGYRLTGWATVAVRPISEIFYQEHQLLEDLLNMNDDYYEQGWAIELKTMSFHLARGLCVVVLPIDHRRGHLNFNFGYNSFNENINVAYHRGVAAALAALGLRQDMDKAFLSF